MTDKTMILVVDDDTDLLEQTKVVLESAGYDVTTAIDSGDAEKKLKEITPALILCDIVMEEVDAGLVFAERFGAQFPVIVLSSIADSSDKIFDVASLPVRGVLQKPMAPVDLLTQVRSVLGE